MYNKTNKKQTEACCNSSDDPFHFPFTSPLCDTTLYVLRDSKSFLPHCQANQHPFLRKCYPSSFEPK